jgi:hypothetical protein
MPLGAGGCRAPLSPPSSCHPRWRGGSPAPLRSVLDFTDRKVAPVGCDSSKEMVADTGASNLRTGSDAHQLVCVPLPIGDRLLVTLMRKLLLF